MYLAGQSHDNDLGESAAGNVIVIENEERPNGSTGSWQPSTTSASTRDRETHPMRQKHPNAQMRLRNDEVDDDDNDEQEKEELPGDNVTCSRPFWSLSLIYTRISIERTHFSFPRRKDARSQEWCWSAGTLSVRGWCCFWSRASSSGPASSFLCSPLESPPPRALARHRDGDSIRYSTRPHTYFHVYIYVYILRPIYHKNFTFLVLNIYMPYYLIINIY